MRGFCSLLLFGCLVLCTAAKASVLNVSPTRLFISPSSQGAVFKLKNVGEEKALIEVKIFAWTDSDDGDSLQPTEDFMIAPPIFEIPPETAQTLRIVPRLKGQLDVEKMYRVIVSEVPSDVGPANGVGFAVEMSLPVFLAPEGAEADPVWSFDWKDIGTQEVRLANHGDAHIRVRSFSVFDDLRDEPIFQTDASAYVLPGEQKAWSMSERLDNIKGPLTVKALTTKGPIEAKISLPGG